MARLSLFVRMDGWGWMLCPKLSSAWCWALSKVNEALNVCAPATYSFSCSMLPARALSALLDAPADTRFTSLSRSHFNCRAPSSLSSRKNPWRTPPIVENSTPAPRCRRHCSVYLQQSQLWRLGLGKFMQSYALEWRKKSLQAPKGHLQMVSRRFSALPNMLHATGDGTGTDAITVAFLPAPNQIFHFKCYLFYCCLPDSKSSKPPRSPLECIWQILGSRLVSGRLNRFKWQKRAQNFNL